MHSINLIAYIMYTLSNSQMLRANKFAGGVENVGAVVNLIKLLFFRFRPPEKLFT